MRYLLWNYRGCGHHVLSVLWYKSYGTEPWAQIEIAGGERFVPLKDLQVVEI